MIQEENQLLLIDLCARLPYHPIVYVDENLPRLKLGAATRVWEYIAVDKPCKPYLRPLSSMTEKEKKELERLIDEKLNRNTDQEDDEWTPWVLYDTTGIKNFIGGERFYFDEMSFIYDWLNAHHFDFRNLIGKGLALEAKEGKYNLNK